MAGLPRVRPNRMLEIGKRLAEGESRRHAIVRWISKKRACCNHLLGSVALR